MEQMLTILQEKKVERASLEMRRKQIDADLQAAGGFRVDLVKLIELLEQCLQDERQFSAGMFEAIMSDALSACLGEGYGFEVEWRKRKDKSTSGARMYVLVSGARLPLDQCASSVRNVVRAISNIIYILLSNWGDKPIRKVFITDEEFANFNETLMPRVAQTLSEMCLKTGLQIITTSHSPNLGEAAANIIRVQRDPLSGVSIVDNQIQEDYHGVGEQTA